MPSPIKPPHWRAMLRDCPTRSHLQTVIVSLAATAPDNQALSGQDRWQVNQCADQPIAHER